MNDQELAKLLGEAPAARDPRFRLDVFARVYQRRQRAIAHRQAALVLVVSAAIGVFFGVAGFFGFTLETLQPLLAAVAVLGLAYMLATETVKGPRSHFARWLSGVRLSRL